MNMNMNLIDLMLLCSNIVFAMVVIMLLIIKSKQRKRILKAVANSKESLRTQIAKDEEILKEVIGSQTTPKLEKKIAEIISIEKDSYNSLINLFVDYHPAAIEMMPVLMNTILVAYSSLIDLKGLLNQVKVSIDDMIQEDAALDAVEEEKVVEDVLDEESKESDALEDEFQYEALIGQLRFEKHDLSNKYRDARKLLDAIYLKYKEPLKLGTPEESFDDMSLSEVAAIFNVELVPTITKTA